MTDSIKISPSPAARFRVIHTEWSDGWGGQEHRIVSEMAGLQRRGHKMLLVTRPGARIADHAGAAGIEVRLLPFSGKANLATILPLRHWIGNEGYQIVNTHSGVDSWIGMFASRGTRAKLVRTRHLNIPLKRSWYNFVHYFYDSVVTCGEAVRDRLINECGFPADSMVSIPTGIDFDAFQAVRRPAEARTELGIPTHSFVILMVGIMRSVKRHDLALQALAAFKAVRPDAHLVIVGDGPKLSDTQALATQLGVREAVSFPGFRDDIPDLMNAADALLLCSDSEGIPQAVTQALGMGLPVVATSVGGVPELIRDGNTGLLVPPDDAAGLSDALLKIAGDRAWAMQLARQGRAFARESYSLAHMCDLTESLYRELLDQRS